MFSSQSRFPQPNPSEPSYCADHPAECSTLFTELFGPLIANGTFPWAKVLQLVGTTVLYSF